MSRTFFLDSARGACAIRANKKGAVTAFARRGSRKSAPEAVTHRASAAIGKGRERLIVIVAQATLVLAFCVIGSALVALDEIKQHFRRGDEK
jgi:hypothetical protein